MKTLSFGKFISQSFKLAWQNKILWILGIFGSGSAAGGFDISWLQGENGTGEVSTEALRQSISQVLNSGWLILIILIFLLIIVLTLLSLVARAGILQSLLLIKQEKEYKFWQLVKFGFSKLGSLLWLSILVSIPILFLVGLFLGIYFVVPESFMYLVVIGGILFVLSVLFLSLFSQYSMCFVVYEKQSAWRSIKSGIDLLMNNFKNCLLALLVQFGLNIVFVLALVLAVIILALPFVILAFLAAFTIGEIAAVIVAVLAGLVLLVALFAVSGYLTVFSNAFVTKVYWALTEKK